MHLEPEQASCRLTTAYGDFRLHGFKEPATGLEHAALCFGDLSTGEPVLVRLHSECLTGDAFGSCHCDCGPQLRSALKAIATAGRGALLYLRQEGRGIGLLNKIRAYALQETGVDTLDANRLLGLPADARDYGFAATMLSQLGIRSVKLLTNNPGKIEGLKAHGVDVVERVSLQVGRTTRNGAYLDTKAHRMGHLFDLARELPDEASEADPAR
ncbi:GTP cyclohydrolase II [Ideonella azotifigens]|uniref:GTP cyclohydrolase II n=1 Tax=Ideonella azotifigens TaxID=513160 RepID=UPI0011421357|nr:GTP cyclohydrolase II [Ideonella azotifigens]MCD2344863.1 GTP cyclohydrolase II [Ideonella azotifigens]